MNRRNFYGMAALLLLLAAMFGGPLLCAPGAGSDAAPSAALRGASEPDPAALAADEPVRGAAAEASAPLASRELLVRVQDMDGRPLLGAEVILHRADRPGAAPAARKFTGAGGTASFAGLPDGTFRVLALAEGHFPAAEQPEARIPSAHAAEVTVTLERGGAVGGFVFGLDGYETPFAWIRLRELDRGDTVLLQADERGAFQSGALRRGAWEVGWIADERAEPDPRIVRTVFVEPGANREVIVTVEATTRGAAREDREVGIVELRRGG